MDDELIHFGSALAKQALSEDDLAVALAWYQLQVKHLPEVRASSIARLMHDLSLRGLVNGSRLAKRLLRHADLVRGKEDGAFKLRLSAIDSLNERYEPLLEKPRPKISDHVVEPKQVDNSRRYLAQIVDQINGNYQFSFYDSCAVMCRRLMESLLIDVFEKQGVSDAIKHKGEYVMLGEIIAQARSGRHFKLARGTADAMEAIKDIGDAAAHNRTYITSRRDIDDIKLRYRRMISELASFAGLEDK